MAATSAAALAPIVRQPTAVKSRCARSRDRPDASRRESLARDDRSVGSLRGEDIHRASPSPSPTRALAIDRPPGSPPPRRALARLSRVRDRRKSVRVSAGPRAVVHAVAPAKKAFFFPGQGAQSVGMAGELCEECPAAKALFDEASEILGYDLLDVCVNGPAEKLNSTEVSQPAIYVASLAALEKMKSTPEGAAEIDAVDVCAGLSLGEYTALTFAGAITFADGVKLVKLRGESMQAAADATKSGMASVIGLAADKVDELCAAASEQSGEPVQIANYLCNGNYAVSGSEAAVDKVAEIAKPEFKARMVVKLAVAGTFHTDFMAPAAEALKAGLADTPIAETRIPVISNVDVEPHADADAVRETLAKQLTSPVQWEKTMQTLLEGGLETSTEVGPGKVISGIMKRIDKKAVCENFTV